MSGLFPDLAQRLASILNFKMVFVDPKTSAFGIKDPETGEWNGMLRVLKDQEADWAPSAIAIIIERTTVVDFTRDIIFIQFMNYRKNTFHVYVITALKFYWKVTRFKKVIREFYEKRGQCNFVP